MFIQVERLLNSCAIRASRSDAPGASQMMTRRGGVSAGAKRRSPPERHHRAIADAPPGIILPTSRASTFYYLFAVLVCCANLHAPTSTRSIGFCVTWVCISSSSNFRIEGRSTSLVRYDFFRCACLLCESPRPHFNPQHWLFVIWVCISTRSSFPTLENLTPRLSGRWCLLMLALLLLQRPKAIPPLLQHVH